MIGAGWMNLASLVPWRLRRGCLPLAALVVRKKGRRRRLVLALVWASAAACAAALISCRSVTRATWCRFDDASAILDTTDALVFVAGALLAVTLALDAVALAVWCAGKGKNSKDA